MQKIGPISCLEIPASSDTDKHLMILIHGYGADAYDLQTLSDVLSPPWPTQYIFPQGPLEVPIGPGWTGRAWWQINMGQMQPTVEAANNRDLSNITPTGIEDLRKKFFALIEATKTSWNKIILAGFSQGAMLATDLFLRAPEPAKGLMIFSGALLMQNEWKELAKQKKGSHFFQSHGQSDAVLGIKGAQRLETMLTQAGLKGRLTSFSGGHEIPMQVLIKANDYLKELT